MKWRIIISKDSDRFIKKNTISDKEIVILIKKTLLYLQGEDINVDVKKLSGNWKGYFRIRKGKLRIIIKFNFEKSIAFVEEIGWRGNVYK